MIMERNKDSNAIQNTIKANFTADCFYFDYLYVDSIWIGIFPPYLISLLSCIVILSKLTWECKNQ